MRGKVTRYDARAGRAEVATKHGVLEVLWPAIRRSGFVPEVEQEIELELTRGVVRKMRRVIVATGKT